MLLLGIDVGTSSIKIAVVDAHSQECITVIQYPETETGITALQKGWAEQNPEMWWEHVQLAILKAHAQKKYNPKDISAIGIAYQMHGLVCVDKNQQVLRDSIIWCDSRAVDLGNAAFDAIGHEKSLQHLLNSPGNFTAAKLAWVKENEPDKFELIDKIMLPGDFIAMKLTGTITTTIPSLSEGVFYDFKEKQLSTDVFNYFGFDTSIIPEIKDVFTTHGTVSSSMAEKLLLKEGVQVSYKAGDQPNNALSLNVMEPGEVAATAGTSGVIYGVSDQLVFDQQSRINSFAHVNYLVDEPKIGVLLCINGTGILNSWIKKICGNNLSYQQMNEAAAAIEPGSNGLQMLPFGNGAERMLQNKMVQGHLHNIDFNVHSTAHLFRAAQEGIAFAFRYGLDIMRENGMRPSVIRAGKANMFLSDVFTQCFVNATNIPVELHNCDGSVGAAKGAGIGAGFYKTAKEAFTNTNSIQLINPTQPELYDNLYQEWKQLLQNNINSKC